jgi:hypothetical protein
MSDVQLNRNSIIAMSNILALTENMYPGRLIVLGMDQTGDFVVMVYVVTGRSEKSRNRVLSFDEYGRVYTEAPDPTKMTDPKLVIYNAMLENHGFFVVSNGAQTDRVAAARSCGVMTEFDYEPDAPHFTPRITGVCNIFDGRCEGFGLSIIRKSRFGSWCDRVAYSYEKIGNGFGFGISTYSGDGNPLPSFMDTPHLLPLRGSIVDIRDSYWSASGPNRVALAVKFIPLAGGKSTITAISELKKVG